MDKRLAEVMFLLMFGISLSAATANSFKSIFPYGVGHVIKEGIFPFLIRASFIVSMVVLSSLGFVLALKFCSNVKSKGIIIDSVNVLIILVLATIPWLCDHVSRILFLPFNKYITIREAEFKHVDIVFVIIYFLLTALLLLVRYLSIIIFAKK